MIASALRQEHGLRSKRAREGGKKHMMASALWRERACGAAGTRRVCAGWQARESKHTMERRFRCKCEWMEVVSTHRRCAASTSLDTHTHTHTHTHTERERERERERE